MAREIDTSLDHAGRLFAGAAIPRRHRRPFLRRSLARLVAWIDRAHQRRALSDLDDHLLRDIGVSREEARREAMRPFWRSGCGEAFD